MQATDIRPRPIDFLDAMLNDLKWAGSISQRRRPAAERNSLARASPQGSINFLRMVYTHERRFYPAVCSGFNPRISCSACSQSSISEPSWLPRWSQISCARRRICSSRGRMSDSVCFVMDFCRALAPVAIFQQFSW